MKHKIEYNKITNKIITDEEVSRDETCHIYFFTGGKGQGIGVIASSREICIKKILNKIKSEIKDLKQELKQKEKLLEELEVMIK